MYFDLFVPFPIPQAPLETSKKKKDKGKGKALPELSTAPKSCWDGLTSNEKDGFARIVALSGHLGYSVIGCTLAHEPSPHAHPSPFRTALPYPELDPRFPSESSSHPSLVQVTRYHMRLDDSRIHCLISIITLPLHEKPYHFRLNRKQIRQAQRNGVVFEILYSAGLFPSPSLPPEIARRYRQNFMSNAREVIRVTSGKGVIFSSGPGGSAEGIRGPLDVVNLGAILGLPANLAKDAVSLNPKMVLLRAQARRTFKAILSTPKMVPPPGGGLAADTDKSDIEIPTAAKRPLETESEGGVKRPKVR